MPKRKRVERTNSEKPAKIWSPPLPLYPKDEVVAMPIGIDREEVINGVSEKERESYEKIAYNLYHRENKRQKHQNSECEDELKKITEYYEKQCLKLFPGVSIYTLQLSHDKKRVNKKRAQNRIAKQLCDSQSSSHETEQAKNKIGEELIWSPPLPLDQKEELVEIPTGIKEKEVLNRIPEKKREGYEARAYKLFYTGFRKYPGPNGKAARKKDKEYYSNHCFKDLPSVSIYILYRSHCNKNEKKVDEARQFRDSQRLLRLT